MLTLTAPLRRGETTVDARPAPLDSRVASPTAPVADAAIPAARP